MLDGLALARHDQSSRSDRRGIEPRHRRPAEQANEEQGSDDQPAANFALWVGNFNVFGRVSERDRTLPGNGDAVLVH